MDFRYCKRHLLSIVLLVSWQAHFGVGTPPTQSNSALGLGYYIPEIDLLTDELQPPSGATIFEVLPPKCTVMISEGKTYSDDYFYTSTESLYNAVSKNFGIGLDLKSAFTLGLSLLSVTDNIVKGNSQASGLSLNLNAHSKDHYLTKDCINSDLALSTGFLEDFEKLESEIDQPWLKDSWRHYKLFLKKYGSHVVKKVSFGSSIQQYAFARSSENYSRRDFTIAACVTLGGLTDFGKINVPECAGISSTEARGASRMSLVKKLVLRGGTPKTRAELTNERSKATITNFLQEGVTHPSPMGYNFVPIWNILKTRFIGKPSMAKVLNLEQFFKGYLNFGCSYEETTNKKVLQKFVLSEDSDPAVPKYNCLLAPEGCQEDSDCHHRHLVRCICAGPSCVHYQDVKLSSGKTKKEAYANTIKSLDWSGHCKFRGKCRCRNENTIWQKSWTDDGGDVLRDAHFVMAKKRNEFDALKEKCVPKKIAGKGYN